MMINRKPIVLKGQHILAQGFGVSAQSNGNALGINAMTKIVRAIMFIIEEFSFRTKWMISCFPKNDVLQFPRHTGAGCPKQNFHILYFGLADGFFGDFFTRGAAPGYAILPLQGEESQKLRSGENRNKY